MGGTAGRPERLRVVRPGWEAEPLCRIAARHAGRPDEALEALRDVRRAGLPLDRAVVDVLARSLGRPAASLWGVLTFYDEFREPVAPAHRPEEIRLAPRLRVPS
ncbi:MAG: hypothetical protein M0Z27_12220 [Thermaerobacter sp.]|nr:hypothetical protein [Thermaerobacter sp.]